MANHTKLIIKRNAPSALARFAALNAEWIEDLHYLEESDKLMVSNPEIYTQNGNSVFSAHLEDVVVGAVALKKHENGEYELMSSNSPVYFSSPIQKTQQPFAFMLAMAGL